MQYLQELTELLERQISNLNTLASLLQRQREAISRNQIDEFEQILASQQPYIDEIEKQSRHLLHLLQSAGYAPDAMSIEQFLAQSDDTQQLIKLWQRLQELTYQCRDENLLNGKIIEICNMQAKQTLQILSGQDAQVELYGPSGKTTKADPLILGKV